MRSTKPLTRYAASLLLVLAATSVTAQPPPADDAAAGAKAPASQAHVLSNAEFDALLTHPDKVLLIDVRRPDEVSSIGGFPVYLSIQLKDLQAQSKWIPRNRTLVTVSNHAGRAGKAADLLASQGFKVAGAIGVQTYEKAGGIVAKVAIPASTAATAPKAE